MIINPWKALRDAQTLIESQKITIDQQRKSNDELLTEVYKHSENIDVFLSALHDIATEAGPKSSMQVKRMSKLAFAALDKAK